MEKITTIGLDIAKQVFPVHGVTLMLSCPSQASPR